MDCTQHLPVPPERKQGLRLTDEEMDARRGAGTCPRSPSKVKDSSEYLWKGRATVRERVREAEGVLMLLGHGQVRLSGLRTPHFPPQGSGARKH